MSSGKYFIMHSRRSSGAGAMSVVQGHNENQLRSMAQLMSCEATRITLALENIVASVEEPEFWS